MAGALRKTMVYLGLAEDQGRYDDEYDEAYDEHRETEDAGRAPRRRGDARSRPATPWPTWCARPRAAGISRITTIHPRTYNEAKTIGENFRDGIPVIMNLTDMNDADAKRLVDFAAGLVFGLRGSIERVTSKVFLLSPETVEVNAEESPGGGRHGASSTRADRPPSGRRAASVTLPAMNAVREVLQLRRLPLLPRAHRTGRLRLDPDLRQGVAAARGRHCSWRSRSTPDRAAAAGAAQGHPAAASRRGLDRPVVHGAVLRRLPPLILV